MSPVCRYEAATYYRITRTWHPPILPHVLCEVLQDFNINHMTNKVRRPTKEIEWCQEANCIRGIVL